MEAPLYTLRPAAARDEAAVRLLCGIGGMDVPGDWARTCTMAVNAQDEPVGFIRVQPTALGPHVAPVAVFPTWRGLGVGRALMEAARAAHGTLKLVSRGESAGFYRALGCVEMPFDQISGELEEDCASCPDRAACGPVPFRY